MSQDYPVNKRLDKINNKTVTIKVVKNKENEEDSKKINCLEDTDNSICSIPNFVSKTKKDVTNWGSKFSNTISIYYEYVESDKEAGTIISQSVKEGTSVKDIIEKSTTITITIAKEKEITSGENTDNNNEEKDNS